MHESRNVYTRHKHSQHSSRYLYLAAADLFSLAAPNANIEETGSNGYIWSRDIVRTVGIGSFVRCEANVRQRSDLQHHPDCVFHNRV